MGILAYWLNVYHRRFDDLHWSIMRMKFWSYLELVPTINAEKMFFLKCSKIGTSNHMFGRAIWNKLSDYIFENFEFGINCPSKTRAISKFSKNGSLIYPNYRPNKTCSYWLITPNQQTLCIETNIFYQREITK